MHTGCCCALHTVLHVAAAWQASFEAAVMTAPFCSHLLWSCQTLCEPHCSKQPLFLLPS